MAAILAMAEDLMDSDYNATTIKKKTSKFSAYSMDYNLYTCSYRIQWI